MTAWQAAGLVGMFAAALYLLNTIARTGDKILRALQEIASLLRHQQGLD